MKRPFPDSWTQVTIPCSAEAVEAVSNFLFEQGASGVEEQEGCLLGYFPEPMDREGLKTGLAAYLNALHEMGLPIGNPRYRVIPRADWGDAWRQHFRPFQATPRIWVKPPWETVKGPSSLVIDIMPRMAFGTGQHETTRLCLLFLEKSLTPGHAVLDLGSGSGILAIAAARLGAGRVLAVEIDPVAIENLEENIRLNGVEDRVVIRQGGFEAVGSERFDLILANLHRVLLTALIPRFPEHLLPHGRVILSGILDSEEATIETAIAAAGLHPLDKRRLGEWTGMLAAMKDR